MDKDTTQLHSANGCCWYTAQMAQGARERARERTMRASGRPYLRGKRVNSSLAVMVVWGRQRRLGKSASTWQ